MLEALNQIFVDHGLWGLFVLMFLNMVVLFPPSELILPLAGFFAYTSGVSVLLVIIISVVANLIGTYVWYFIGKKFGYEWLFKIKYFRKIVKQKDLERVNRKFHDEESYWVGVFRLFPSIRAWISLFAGMIRMPHRTFVLYSTIGMTIWTIFWVLLGYYFGLGFVKYRSAVWIILAVMFVIVVYLFVVRIHRHVKKRS